MRVSWFASLLALSLVVPVAAQPAVADPATQVAAALAAGEAALARHDARRLMAAAATLARHRAHGEDGQDLAQIWAHQATAWGAAPVAIPVWRGRLGGPGYRRFELAAGARFETRQVFSAGQQARVALAVVGPAPGAGRFRLSIAGGDASRLCSREAIVGQVACTWTPPFSEPHAIVVENAQAVPARFYLVTD